MIALQAEGVGNVEQRQQGERVNLNTLRADFSTVRAFFVRFEEWTPDEASEVGEAIALAVNAANAGDAGELAFWSWWMRRYAEVASGHLAYVADVERRAAEWCLSQQRLAA